MKPIVPRLMADGAAEKEVEMRWTKAEKDFMSAARVARLATVGSNGAPYNVPVCPLFDNGKIYLGTKADAKKVRNIQSNPCVTLVFDDYSEDWEQLRGMMVQGRALVLDLRKFREMRKKLYAKYLQYQSSSPLTDGEAAIIAVTPGKKFKWGL